MIDLHSHILPGLDDGVRSLQEARELACASLADGVRAIAATPHVREDYPTTADEMEEALAAVRADLACHGIQIDLHSGGELSLDAVRNLSAAELRRFSLGGTGRYALVEFPYYGWPLGIEHDVRRLAGLGLGVLLAHPERNPDVQQRPGRLSGLVGAGALVQVTAASVDGRLGNRNRRASEALVANGSAHVLASDAHSPDLRAAGLSAAATALGNSAFARHVTVDVPRAILAGRSAPGWFSPSRQL